jgi:hypothetical protein
VVVDAPALGGVRQLVVWIPMLDSDERPAAVRSGAMFRGAGVAQFWDGGQLLGKEVARSVGASPWVAWDVYLFYGPGAEWTGAGLPPPAAALAQAGGERGGGVVAMRGTLPARGDQSTLPRFLEGKAVVAGGYAELPELLASVAGRFARTAREVRAP